MRLLRSPIRFRTPLRIVYRTPYRPYGVVNHYYPKATSPRAIPRRIATPAAPEGSTPAIKEQARLLGLPMTDEEARRQRAELKRLKERREQNRLEEVD